MNKETLVFKPDDIIITLDGKDYRLVYDLNAFCELEKIYDSIDYILQLLLGTPSIPDTGDITYNGAVVNPDEILIGETPLTTFILQNAPQEARAKHVDTRNLLWAGLLHDHAIYDEHEEIVGYTISKHQVGSMVSFKNLREINAQIVLAILRDLLPPGEEEKNEEAPVREPIQLVSKTEA